MNEPPAAPSARFRPHERMRDPRDFRQAFEGRKTASDDLLIVYARRNGLDHARLGVSVGKKKVKTAVGRNRIKRAVREAFRLNKSQFPPGVDYVVVPRGKVVPPGLAIAAFAALARGAARRVGMGTRP